MIEIYVLNENLEQVGVVDTYNSLIWAPRYAELGDCEIYLPATDENIALLRTGYYLSRLDDDMVCRIDHIELTTDAEAGNYLTVKGTDAKGILDQRIIFNTSVCSGLVEEFLRQLVTDAVLTTTVENTRKIDIIELGDLAGFTEYAQEQVSYKNLGEKIRETCTKNGWGYRFRLNDNNKLAFELYAGQDKRDSVIFAPEYDNLLSTSYTDSCRDMLNCARIGGAGEGTARKFATLGTATGINRYETFIDAKDLSLEVSYSELTQQFPGGTVVQGESGYYYRLPELLIRVVDAGHKTWLEEQYDGEFGEIDGQLFFWTDLIGIATVPSATPGANDTCTWADILYYSFLLERGLDALSGQGELETFEGSIIPDVTFKYKQDYNLGDIVRIQNEFGIGADVRIVEIIESLSDTGHSIEPSFEYLKLNTDNFVTYIQTQNKMLLLTQNEQGIVTENSIPTTSPQGMPEGVKITQLDEATELDANYYFPVANESDTLKVSYQMFRNIFVPAEADKGLSQNDFTNTLKDKLDGIASGAEVNVQADWAQADSSADDFIKNKPSIVPSNSGQIMHLLGNISNGGSWTFTIPSSFRGLILFQGTASANHALWSIVTSTSGTVTVNEFHSAGLTYTKSANTLTVTNGTGATSYVSYIGNKAISIT